MEAAGTMTDLEESVGVATLLQYTFLSTQSGMEMAWQDPSDCLPRQVSPSIEKSAVQNLKPDPGDNLKKVPRTLIRLSGYIALLLSG